MSEIDAFRTRCMCCVAMEEFHTVIVPQFSMRLAKKENYEKKKRLSFDRLLNGWEIKSLRLPRPRRINLHILGKNRKKKAFLWISCVTERVG